MRWIDPSRGKGSADWIHKKKNGSRRTREPLRSFDFHQALNLSIASRLGSSAAIDQLALVGVLVSILLPKSQRTTGEAM
jgi:hypothetical protein